MEAEPETAAEMEFRQSSVELEDGQRVEARSIEATVQMEERRRLRRRRVEAGPRRAAHRRRDELRRGPDRRVRHDVRRAALRAVLQSRADGGAAFDGKQAALGKLALTST